MSTQGWLLVILILQTKSNDLQVQTLRFHTEATCRVTDIWMRDQMAKIATFAVIIGSKCILDIPRGAELP